MNITGHDKQFPDEAQTWNINNHEETDYQLEGLPTAVIDALKHLGKVAGQAEKEGFTISVNLTY